MKIGIPRALLYYYYFPFWEVFFNELGIDIVVSPKTSKSILDKGIKESVAEICVPIKIFNGHVVSLLEKELDYIFIPRMVSIKKRELFCPKFLGLPDLVRHSIHNAENKILYPQIAAKTDDISKADGLSELSEPLGVSLTDIKNAAKKAGKVWKEFNILCMKEYSIPEAYALLKGKKIDKPQNTDITIGLLGYVYNIYDEFISMNVYKKLQSLNVKILTFEMLNEKKYEKHLKKMNKRVFWTFSNKLLGSMHYFNNSSNVDGIIHFTAFVCGPDSMLGKVFEFETQKTNKPFMTVRIDEHTGENHLLTRIEAFVDMIRRSKNKGKGVMGA